MSTNSFPEPYPKEYFSGPVTTLTEAEHQSQVHTGIIQGHCPHVVTCIVISTSTLGFAIAAFVMALIALTAK